MKKICLLSLLSCCIFMAGCGNHELGEGESIYNGDLIVAGVGPEISFEPTVEEGTLVLKGYFEYHSDHIFLNEGLREKYLKDESDYLPGNEVKFKGVIEFLDGAAGNHYYNVKSIDKLEVVDYPNAEEIKEIFDSYNYCESDSDCEYIVGKCPFGCYIPVNKSFINISDSIINNYYMNNQGEKCVYGCVAMDKVVCENYKCEMKSSEEDEGSKDVVYCTPEQKMADFCTMEYAPVCGSDSRTYGNSCVACQSETVESYTQGECESSAFVVEGDSEYLMEAMDILNRDGAVSCNLIYADYGRQVHALFMADKDRFYSEMDDYSDNNRNQNYLLVMNGKTYYRSTFPDSDNIVQDFSTDIENEIASYLMDISKYPDFQMDCSGGIENENLFIAPEI